MRSWICLADVDVAAPSYGANAGISAAQGAAATDAIEGKDTGNGQKAGSTSALRL